MISKFTRNFHRGKFLPRVSISQGSALTVEGTVTLNCSESLESHPLINKILSDRTTY